MYLRLIQEADTYNVEINLRLEWFSLEIKSIQSAYSDLSSMSFSTDMDIHIFSANLSLNS